MDDEELDKILNMGEAGVGDAMAAYEAVEQQYMEAAAYAPLEPMYATFTVNTAEGYTVG